MKKGMAQRVVCDGRASETYDEQFQPSQNKRDGGAQFPHVIAVDNRLGDFPREQRRGKEEGRGIEEGNDTEGGV